MYTSDVSHEPRQIGTADRYLEALNQTAIVAMTDRRGIITFVNDTFCAISKYRREELLGQNHRLLNSGHHPKSFFTDMFRAIASGQTWRADVCNRAKDGSIYWVDTTIVPMRDAEGTIDGFFSIRQDITDRKLRETASEQKAEMMQAASRAKSEFLANMSHEIRTPLNAIMGYTDVLSSETVTAADRTTHLETIRRNGEHLLGVINDVLDISKIEAGQMSVEVIDVMTVEIIAEVVSLMQVRADAKGLALDLEFETEIPQMLRTDPVRLRQVLINLIGNAIKFTEMGGVRLIVGLEDAESTPTLRMEVADTGIGMTKEQCDKVFQPFEQADSSTTRKFGGTGLGLYISRRLSAMLKGEIALLSQVGEGTSFVVRLPTGTSGRTELISAEAAWDGMLKHHNLKNKKNGGEISRSLDGKRILVAEDGPDNQRLVSHFLRKAGAEPIIVENGKLAVEAINSGETYDAVLMDIQMPEMDGHQATRVIRQSGYSGPVIALSAHAMIEEREAMMSDGCDDFLTKPINRPVMVDTIDRWCRLKSNPEIANAHDQASSLTGDCRKAA